MNQIRKQQKKKTKLQHKAVKLAALFALKMMISQKEKKEALAAAEGKTTSGKISSKVPDPMHVLYFALGGKAAGLNPKKVEKAAAAATLLSAATTVGNPGISRQVAGYAFRKLTETKSAKKSLIPWKK